MDPYENGTIGVAAKDDERVYRANGVDRCATRRCADVTSLRLIKDDD
jgi:hypothetical protein